MIKSQNSLPYRLNYCKIHRRGLLTAQMNHKHIPYSVNHGQNAIVSAHNIIMSMCPPHIQRIWRYVAVSASLRSHINVHALKNCTHSQRQNNMWRWTSAHCAFCLFGAGIIKLTKIETCIILKPTLDQLLKWSAYRSQFGVAQPNEYICRCFDQTFTDQILGHVFHEPQMLRNVDVAYTHTHTHTPSASRDSEALMTFF